MKKKKIYKSPCSRILGQCGFGSRYLMTKNCKMLPYGWKRSCLLWRIAIYLSQGLKSSSLTSRDHLTLQNNTVNHIFGETNFAFLDLDLADQNQCGSMQIRIHNTYVLKSPLVGNSRSQSALSILCEESERNSWKKQLPIDSALTYSTCKTKNISVLVLYHNFLFQRGLETGSHHQLHRQDLFTFCTINK